MINAFTVDLEDWFCSHNLKSAISFDEWEKQESRIEGNTFQLLTILQKHNVKATFFVLGWIAARFPELIKIIQGEGHEIACHGYAHQLVSSIQPADFADDLSKATGILRSITGLHPLGYRAPAFSINAKTNWAFPVLRRLGYKYDSSVYPLSVHPDYGYRKASLEIHVLHDMLEIPLTCSNICGVRVPCSGGAYLRFYPYSMFSHFIKTVIKKKRSVIFYIHPWELDKDPANVYLPYFKSVRHHYNTGSSIKKLNKLLSEFEFSTMTTVIQQQKHDWHLQVG